MKTVKRKKQRYANLERKEKMKKILAISLVIILAIGAFVGCGAKDTSADTKEPAAADFAQASVTGRPIKGRNLGNGIRAGKKHKTAMTGFSFRAYDVLRF